MSYQEMWVVTQTSPYVDGPAGVHGVLTQAERALCEIALMKGLNPEVIRDVATLPPTRLRRTGVLALFNIGETPFNHAQKKVIKNRWDEGRISILGVHAATDACHTWPEYGGLLGARFDGHPWTQDFSIDVLDASHPATKHLGASWSWKDEVYLFKDFQPDAKPLLALSPGQLDMKAPGARTPDCGFPLAWTQNVGQGRTFYSALGHFSHAWETPTYLQHLSGGLEWLLSR